MSSCKEKFGKRIKELRKSKKLTQDKLAELVKFEANHVTKIEAGIHFPQPEKLETIAEVLGVKVKDLFDFDHKIPEQSLKNSITNWLEDAQVAEIEYIYKTINNLKEFKRELKR